MAAKKNVKTLNLGAVFDLIVATVLRDKLLSLRCFDVSMDGSAVERV